MFLSLYEFHLFFNRFKSSMMRQAQESILKVWYHPKHEIQLQNQIWLVSICVIYFMLVLIIGDVGPFVNYWLMESTS